jgi:hypothetical protein
MHYPLEIANYAGQVQAMSWGLQMKPLRQMQVPA